MSELSDARVSKTDTYGATILGSNYLSTSSQESSPSNSVASSISSAEVLDDLLEVPNANSLNVDERPIVAASRSQFENDEKQNKISKMKFNKEDSPIEKIDIYKMDPTSVRVAVR